ncbi:DUF4358 domain-containing protein [Turicibacter sanguinis]|uniref:DUF4358 domain-containing protein n=1 Tax=Turicibacter sanguinis TaxID=154288 RepID=UPI00189A47BE|nr:DUF4358 domain-containing protein [Turicibacter sanguinis]MDB8556228.1 DUF4358 domain-containing protein [Turicibacter sanguinis]
MKKLKMMLMALLVTVVAVGCSNSKEGESASNTSATPEEIMNKIQETLASDYDMQLQDGVLPGFQVIDMTDSLQLGMYADHFNTADIEAGYMLLPMMNVKSSLIMVVKAKDEKASESVKDGFEKVLSDQEATWSMYLPDQYELVQENQIKQQGNYLLYVTSDVADKIVKVFEESVK